MNDINLHPGFISAPEAAAFMTRLHREVEWRCTTVRLGGRATSIPRLQAWFGDPGTVYRYSGAELQPLPWPPAIAELRDRVRNALDVPFNSVLVNLYRTGDDTVVWHRDNEKYLGPEPVIASLSLGATRRFEMRPRVRQPRAKDTLSWHLGAGDLLVMRGRSQSDWQHRVPREPDVREPRINLTFRVVRIG